MARRDQPKDRKLELLSQLTSHRKDITVKKQILVQRISESKDQLQDQIKDQIKDKINVPKIVTTSVKSSFSNSPNKWFIGSALGGIIISKVLFGTIGSIFRKPKKQRISHGLLYSIAGMAARPMIKSFLIGKARNYVANRLIGQQPQSYQQETYQDTYRPQNRY